MAHSRREPRTSDRQSGRSSARAGPGPFVAGLAPARRVCPHRAWFASASRRTAGISSAAPHCLPPNAPAGAHTPRDKPPLDVRASTKRTANRGLFNARDMPQQRVEKGAKISRPYWQPKPHAAPKSTCHAGFAAPVSPFFTGLPRQLNYNLFAMAQSMGKPVA